MPTPRAGYHTQDGTKVPSVTTILGRWKESGGLLQWAFKQGQSGARTLYEQRDAAAEIGTMAHEMCDSHMRGGDPQETLDGFHATPEQAEKARTAFRAFLTWVDNHRAEMIACETPLVSETHRFGGTPDFLVRIDGKLAMADLKTSNSVYRDYLLQVAAYGLLWNETQSEKITGGFHILRLGKDNPDFGHHYFPELDGAADLFLLLRKAYDMDLVLKKRAA